jgi:predicted nucleic acid-binding protein
MIPMVLVDTSIWVTHFREGHQRLDKLLTEAMVLCHPFIVGELTSGHLQNRREILHLLQSLPMAPVVEFDAVLFFIERRGLMGRGGRLRGRPPYGGGPAGRHIPVDCRPAPTIHGRRTGIRRLWINKNQAERQGAGRWEKRSNLNGL